MEKTKQTMELNNMPHIGQLIKEAVRRQGRGPKWLSEQIHCSRINVYNIYRCRSLNTELLYKISEVLGEDFFAVYSDALRLDVKKNYTKS